MRLARAATGRDAIIKFEGCYHGHGDSFLISAGSGALTFGAPSSPGVTSGAARDTLLASYNDLASVEQVFDEAEGKIACVITEPVAANMGVVPPAEGFLEGLRKLCDRIGARLTIVYAPTKPHVVMPLVYDKLPADKLRAFTAMKAKSTLPPADEFKRSLFDDLDVKEAVTQQWCKSNGVGFISLTAPLRDAVRKGQQVFYTYDEHWSPTGHEVVADVVLRHKSELTGTTDGG